jgi:SNF2 family DNA or RNA helicase
MRAFKSEYMFQLTGSPAPHDPGDYWAQLHLLDPKTFPSYWAFVNKYMHLVELDYKPEIKVIEGIRDRAGLKELLSRFALRRTKRSVGIQLPAKIRQTIPCRLNKRQQVTYNDMERDFVTKLAEDHWVLSPNAMVTALRLRQLAISPAVLGGEDNSGVLDAVMEQLILDLEAGNKVVIFSCFRKPLDLIAGRIQAKKLGLDCIFMVGGLKTDEVSARLKRFDTGASQLLLASVSIAQGWAATSANTAYFVGPDYSAEVNYQAEDRLHRIGQTRTVVIKYFMTPEDERLQDILNNKVRLRNLTEIVTTALATSDEFGS